MSSYRQIRPSWVNVPTTREETVITSTPAPPPAPSSTGTSAIYQQVIKSLQNQVATLLTMYMENHPQEPAPAQVYYERSPQVRSQPTYEEPSYGGMDPYH